MFLVEWRFRLVDEKDDRIGDDYNFQAIPIIP
jgi:hypothetical protein